MSDETGPTAEEAGVDPTDTDAEDPKDPDSGAETRKKTVEKGNALADTLLGRKLKAINSRIDSDVDNGREVKISDNEGKLLLADRLKSRGWELGEYAQDTNGDPRDGIELQGGGLPVTTEDSREIVITHITGQRPPPNELKAGDIIYYTYKDPAKPGDAPEISGDDLAAAQLKAEADAIGSLFSDPNEASLVAWRARGEEDDPPEDVINSVEAKLNADPFDKANQTIAEQITLLTASLSAEGLSDEQRSQTTKLLTELKLAEVLSGDIGALFKLNALKHLRETAGPATSTSIDSILADLEPQRQAAQAAIEQMIINTGQPQDRIDKWKQMELIDLIKDPDFINLPDMSEQIFGKDLTPADATKIDTRLMDYADAHIPDHQRKAWETAKKSGKAAGLLLAILLAIPAAVAVGVTYTVASSGGGRR